MQQIKYVWFGCYLFITDQVHVFSLLIYGISEEVCGDEAGKQGGNVDAILCLLH